MIIDSMLRRPLPARTFLNINVPRGQPRGYRVTVLAKRNHVTAVAERPQRRCQRRETLGSIPVVIGEKNASHGIDRLYQRRCEGHYVCKPADCGGGTTMKSSAVETTASVAPVPKAAAAPYTFQMAPNSRLAARAPIPCTEL